MVAQVTEASQISQSTLRTSKGTKSKTTITPFSEVLQNNTEKTAETQQSTIVVTKHSDTQNTTAATSSDSTVDAGVSKKLKSIFQKASDKYNVPYNFLVAIAKAESNFNVNATSKSGAQGIMQLMPATAKALGVKDAYDPEQNIMGAAKYLASHLKAFDGDTDLAAAAYNAGGDAVRKYNGIPPYSETQNYVKTVNKYMNQGVSVPDKSVTVASDSTTTTSTGNNSSGVTNAVAATEEELNNSTVVIGTGDDAVTMTYGAYLRYLELGSMGVG